MVALRLVRLIETYSDKIAAGLAAKIDTSARRGAVQQFPKFELLIFIRDLLEQLKEWLLDNKKTEIKDHFCEMGARLAAQGIALAHICRVAVITKEQLWRFLQEQALPRPIELYGEMELLWIVSQFFDRTLCCIVEGYGQSGFQRRSQPEYPEVNLANLVP